MSIESILYKRPSQMEPLCIDFLSGNHGEILDEALEILKINKAYRTYVFEINAECSNMIEGEIASERAIDLHIQAEKFAFKNIGNKKLSELAIEIHAQLYGGLEKHENFKPGKLRTLNVSVGRHIAPDHEYLKSFLDRFDAIYERKLEISKEGGPKTADAILHCFIAHHRFCWIHPFKDGNGRTSRILLNAMRDTPNPLKGMGFC